MDMCSICHDTLCMTTRCVRTACGHYFCEKLSDWLRVSNTCPMCRTDFTTVVPIFTYVSAIAQASSSAPAVRQLVLYYKPKRAPYRQRQREMRAREPNVRPFDPHHRCICGTRRTRQYCDATEHPNNPRIVNRCACCGLQITECPNRCRCCGVEITECPNRCTCCIWEACPLYGRHCLCCSIGCY